MNGLERLSRLPPALRRKRGVEHIVQEICRQPQSWETIAGRIGPYAQEVQEMIRSWESKGGETSIVVTGAGSSEFIGRSIASILRRRLNREVRCYPTTHFVTDPDAPFVYSRKYIVISFARSGNSPESVFTFKYLKSIPVPVKQIVITCDRNGELARLAADDPESLCIVLPEETNDKALAMTNSFSTMALAGIGLTFPSDSPEFMELAASLCRSGRRILSSESEKLLELAKLPFNRACYLGSNTLFGTMQECSLKMQEMTAGKVVSIHNSFLGIRHGPMVFINDQCLVVAAVSSRSHVRRYELDLLRHLKDNRQGCALLTICNHATDSILDLSTAVLELTPNGSELSDEFRVLTDVMVGQILATGKAMELGIKPDNPSPDGIISRVVQGVTIYPEKSACRK